MKTVQNFISINDVNNCKIRFIAVSATIGNVEDIAEWIGSTKYFRFPEEIRPVQLNKIVMGFNAHQNHHFKFDLSLNYRLQSLLIQHSEGKPTLIFCSTRKSVEMTAKHLLQTLNIKLDLVQQQKLQQLSEPIYDLKIKEMIKNGIGVHHAGIDPTTRHTVEEIFRGGDLPIMIATSTLAMGVNLPAHLVIIKSTKCYTNRGFQDYSATAIHQMIGRAGRPQFDTSATALILTTNEDKAKIERMLSSTQAIESNLHRHLTEHLNAEVVLRTITGLDVALQWLASTFLYIRARANPRHYGLSLNYTKDQLDRKLLEIFQIDLNKLVSAGMITMDENINVSPTITGNLMAKYYVDFETMRMFTQISGKEAFVQILSIISKCEEFADMRLRVNDKKTLNLLNKNTKKQTIRFPLDGKIKTWDMKVNCIIQAVLGNLEIADVNIQTESYQILRSAQRIIKCLIDYILMRKENFYMALLNSIILGKCLTAKLWENSPFVSKQLSGIGSTFATQLANAGKDTFGKILESNARDVELIIKRKAPFGDYLIEEVKHLPIFMMNLEPNNYALRLTVELVNVDDIRKKSTINTSSVFDLLVGNNLNEIIVHVRYQLSDLINNPQIVKFVSVLKPGVELISAHFINEDWVGIDCSCDIVVANVKKSEPSPEFNSPKPHQPSYKQTCLDTYMKSKKFNKGKTSAKKIENDNFLIMKPLKNIIPPITSIKSFNQKPSVEANNNKNIQSNVDIIDNLPTIHTGMYNELEHTQITDTNTAQIIKSAAKPELTIFDLYDLPEESITEKSINSTSTEETSHKVNKEIDKIVKNVSHSKENLQKDQDQLTSFFNSEEFLFSDTELQEYEELFGGGKTTKKVIDQLERTKSLTELEKDTKESMFEENVTTDRSFKKCTKYEENNEETMKPTVVENNVSVPNTTIDEGNVETEESTNNKLDVNCLSKGNPLFFSLSHKYLTDEGIGNTNTNTKSTSSLNNVTLKNILNPRGRKRRKQSDIHPAEELEDQLTMEKREQSEKRNCFSAFRKPQKAKMTHNRSFPDSTVNSQLLRSPIFDQEEDRCGTNAEYYSDNQKNVKWKSPLIFSPGIKFSPNISYCSSTKENVDSELQTDSHNHSFDTIPTNSPRLTRKLETNVHKTPKLTRNFHSPNSNLFPLSDKDYERSQEFKKSMERDNGDKFSKIYTTQLLDNSKTKNITSTSKKLSHSNLDYYSQLMPLCTQIKTKKRPKKDLNRSLEIENKENLDRNDCEDNKSTPSIKRTSKSDLNESRLTYSSQSKDDFIEDDLDINVAHNRSMSHDFSGEIKSWSEEYIDSKIQNKLPVYPEYLNRPNVRLPDEYYGYDTVPYRNIYRPPRMVTRPVHCSRYVDYGKYRNVYRAEMPATNFSQHSYIQHDMIPISRNQHYVNVEPCCDNMYQGEMTQPMTPLRRTHTPEGYAETRPLTLQSIPNPSTANLPSRQIYIDNEVINNNGSFRMQSSPYPRYLNQSVPVSYTPIHSPEYSGYFPRMEEAVPYEYASVANMTAIDKEYLMNKYWGSINNPE